MRNVPYLSFRRGSLMVYVYHVREFGPSGFAVRTISKRVRLLRPRMMGRIAGWYCRLEDDPGAPVQFIPWTRLYPDYEYAEVVIG